MCSGIHLFAYLILPFLRVKLSFHSPAKSQAIPSPGTARASRETHAFRGAVWAVAQRRPRNDWVFAAAQLLDFLPSDHFGLPYSVLTPWLSAGGSGWHGDAWDTGDEQKTHHPFSCQRPQGETSYSAVIFFSSVPFSFFVDVLMGHDSLQAQTIVTHLEKPEDTQLVPGMR